MLSRPVRRRPGLWMGAGYGGYFAAIGAFTPFLVLYYRHLGLTGAEIGVLTSMQPLATAFLAPLWGLLADVRGLHRLILRTALVCAGLIALLLSRAGSFVPIVVLVGLLAFVGAPIVALLDSFAITISGRYGVAYGNLRVWGSAGYVISAAVVGNLLGGTVTGLFLVVYAGLLLLAAFSTLGLPPLQERRLHNTWRGAGSLLRRPAIAVLLVTTYLVAVAITPMYNFLGVYLMQLGGSMRLVGAVNSVAGLSELPVMLFGAAFANTLGSRRMLIMAITIYAFRLLAYSVIPAPGWVLPVQLLHGLSFGANLMASVALINQLVGSELAATAQGLLASSYAFGQITGALAGGVLLDRVELPTIFRLGASVALLGLVVLLVGSRALTVDDKPAPAAQVSSL